MAKRKAQAMPTMDKEYQEREDVDRVMRYQEVAQDAKRLARALSKIRSAAELAEPRKPARKPARSSARG